MEKSPLASRISKFINMGMDENEVCENINQNKVGKSEK